MRMLDVIGQLDVEFPVASKVMQIRIESRFVRCGRMSRNREAHECGGQQEEVVFQFHSGDRLTVGEKMTCL